MDVPLLRTMTEKSVIGFGKHALCTVTHILRLGKNDYLRWLYYNINGITFTEDLLYKINIRGKWKIEKPGKDPQKGYNLDESLIKWRVKKSANTHPISHHRNVMKSKYKAFKIVDGRKFSKGTMQRKNQGH